MCLLFGSRSMGPKIWKFFGLDSLKGRPKKRTPCRTLLLVKLQATFAISNLHEVSWFIFATLTSVQLKVGAPAAGTRNFEIFWRERLFRFLWLIKSMKIQQLTSCKSEIAKVAWSLPRTPMSEEDLNYVFNKPFTIEEQNIYRNVSQLNIRALKKHSVNHRLEI